MDIMQFGNIQVKVLISDKTFSDVPEQIIQAAQLTKDYQTSMPPGLQNKTHLMLGLSAETPPF